MGSVVTEGLARSFLVLLRPILPRFRPSGHKPSCRVRQGSSNRRWQGRFPQCRPDSAGGGGARHLGNRFGAAAGVFRSRWVRIFSITWGSSMYIWTHPVLQDTFPFETRRRLLAYIRPVDANVLSLALMNSARLDLNRRSASIEPLHRSGSQDDGLTCLVINRYCVLATC